MSPVEFGTLDDFENFQKAKVSSKSSDIWTVGCKIKLIDFDKTNSPLSQKVKGLIQNKIGHFGALMDLGVNVASTSD